MVALRLDMAVMWVRLLAPPEPLKMSANAAVILGNAGFTVPVLLNISRKASRSPWDRVMYAPPAQLKTVLSSDVAVRMSCRLSAVLVTMKLGLAKTFSALASPEKSVPGPEDIAARAGTLRM